MFNFRLLTAILIVAILLTFPKSALSASTEENKVAVGFIDKCGNFAIKPRFGLALDFSEGIAWTSAIGDFEHKQAINKRGRTLFDLTSFEWPGSFHSGLASVRRGYRFGFVDTKGEIVIPFQYLSVKPFQNGVAVVEGENQLTTFIDTKGVALSNKSPKSLSSVKEINHHGSLTNDGDGRLRFISSKSDDPKERHSHFSEGLAWIQYSSSSEPERFAYIDEQNHVLFQLNPDVEMVGDFHEGLAPILVNVNGLDNFGRPFAHRIGFIDKLGKIVISPKFTPTNIDNLNFSDGMARLRIDSTTCCYIDQKGRSIGPFFFGGEFHDGLAKVSALIDSMGRIIDPRDHRSGYQTRTSYEMALLSLLRDRLKVVKTQGQLKFTVNPAQNCISDIEVIQSSGDSLLDDQVVTLVKGVIPPKRGLLLPKNSPFTFLLENDRLSVDFTRVRELDKNSAQYEDW